MTAQLDRPLPQDPLLEGGETTTTQSPIPPETLEPSAQRLFFADNLRVFLTILVVIHHLAITYSAVAPWYYVEPATDPAIQIGMLILILVNQAFFMGFFYLIAGYFTPGAYDRKKGRRFLGDRWRRLGIPLLIYIFFLNPLASFAGYQYAVEVFAGGVPIPYAEFYLITLNAGPLWFLELLLVFVLFYVLWRRIRRSPAPTNNNHTQPIHTPPTKTALIGFTIALAVVTIIWRVWVPVGTYVPILALPTPSHLPQYLSLFSIGILAYRRNWFFSLPARWMKPAFGIALAATATLLPLALSDLSTAWMGGIQWRAWLFATWEALFCVSICIGLFLLFRRYANTQEQWSNFLSTHAYTVFIIHGPVIAWFAYSLGDIHLHPVFKFILVAWIAVPLCFLVAYFVRKLPRASRIL